ncbi:MAG: ATP-binding protein [Chloroflexi bacterium]|uniref:ATP-binding protein n=1 Tax=Candidatus Flexifilum breve TaxID=3140694 RepID=UPI0031372768|nr:ATP-binding protein [Chloroflexota bacterium]
MALNPNPPRSVSLAARQQAERIGATWSPVVGRYITEAEREYWRGIREGRAAVTAISDEPETCPVCGGLGMVRSDLPREHADYGRLFPCFDPNCSARQSQERDRYARLNKAAAIPEEYADLTFSKWQALIATDVEAMAGKWDGYMAARAFAAAAGRRHMFTMGAAAAALSTELNIDIEPAGDPAFAANGLVLTGANGVGKTSLAVSIVQQLVGEGRAVVYVRMNDLFRDLKKTFRSNADEQEEDVMERYQRAPVLIIDELTPDRAQPTEWQLETVHQLINGRHVAKLPTVITTNTPYATFKDLWGPTVESRVKTYHWVTMAGKVLRARAKEVVSR